MLKFLFGGRGQPAIIETKRQSFERLVAELNAAIDELPEKPKVTLDPATGHVAFELPEQMPDEALALPKPVEDAPDAAVQSDAEADEETQKKVA